MRQHAGDRLLNQIVGFVGVADQHQRVASQRSHVLGDLGGEPIHALFLGRSPSCPGAVACHGQLLRPQYEPVQRVSGPLNPHAQAARPQKDGPTGIAGGAEAVGRKR